MRKKLRVLLIDFFLTAVALLVSFYGFFFYALDPNVCKGTTGKVFLDCHAMPYTSPILIIFFLFGIYKSFNNLYREIKRERAASRYKKLKEEERAERGVSKQR